MTLATLWSNIICILPHFCKASYTKAISQLLSQQLTTKKEFRFSNKKMADNNEMRPLHIAMYPWFAFGHLTSFLHLANKVAEQGHKVSFFIPTKTQLKLAQHNHHPNLITFIPITVPPVDGLPTGAETTNDAPHDIPLVMTAMDLTQDMIEAQLIDLKPDFVLYDFTEWLPELARKHGIKSVYYATVYLVCLAYFNLQGRNVHDGHQLMEAGLMDSPRGFPFLGIKLKALEARGLTNLFMMEFGGNKTFLERCQIAFKECDAIGIKSCREMEGSYCEFVEKQYGKPVILAGPVVPEPPASTLVEQFDSWLKGFSHRSVIYCALGSESVLDKDQFQELLLGLELTERPFIAALKPPPGCETFESALPEGFASRTKGRAMVHGGWVQQQLILQHPSIGCFITHCGAGSLSEAMLVLMPQAVDQFINARMMSLELRVGVEVEKREEDGFFTKESILKAVLIVLEEESEVGREVKANHAKWRDFLLSEGLEKSYIDNFIQGLQNLLG